MRLCSSIELRSQRLQLVFKNSWDSQTVIDFSLSVLLEEFETSTPLREQETVEEKLLPANC